MEISIANVIGWIITVAIFVAVQIVSQVKTNAKQSERNEQFAEAIKLLTKADTDLLAKINDVLNYNASTFVRKDVYEQCHREIKEKLESIEGLNFPERFARLETELAHIRAILEKRG
jgi:polyribonucleotide nucleotidyltransferase